jgi:hypothetical protein
VRGKTLSLFCLGEKEEGEEDGWEDKEEQVELAWSRGKKRGVERVREEVATAAVAVQELTLLA